MIYAPINGGNGAFLGGNVITLSYTSNYTCYPSLSKLYTNISQSITNLTDCGIVIPKNVISTFPIWAITPAFANFSVYGFQKYNSTPQGYPIFNGNVIITDCGAGGSSAACPYTPRLRYTPQIGRLEASIEVYNGLYGFPEGLLPMPAHDYIMLNDYGGFPTPLYMVFVRVFDPNIFPNATTGRCMQVAPSNLSNPIGNCLTSFEALRNAATTRNSYIPQINAKNKLWYLEGNSTKQVVIILNSNNTGISSLLYPNSNVYLFIKANRSNFYSSIPKPPNKQNSSTMWIVGLGVVMTIIVIVNILLIRRKLKNG